MAFKEELDVGLAIVKAKFLRRAAPVYVQFAVTNRCNLQCRYCNIPYRVTEDLGLKEICAIVDRLAQLGTKRMILLGGEPLLRNDIGEIIRYIKNKGIHCGLTTNGYFLKPRIEDIKILDTLAISIDGDAKENDYLRGSGSYLKAIEALFEAKKRDVPVILSTTITKANINSLPSVLAIARRFDCRALINIAYHSNISSLTAKEYLATDAEYKILIREILAQKKAGAPVLLSEQTYQYIFHWPDCTKDRIVGDGKGGIPPDSPECHAGKLFCYIDADGLMYPCALNVGETEALHCIEVGVKKAWQNCAQHTCRACCVACFVEYNSIFSLRPRAIFNTITSYKR